MNKLFYSMTLVMTMMFMGCGDGGGETSTTPDVSTPPIEKALELNVKTEVRSGEVYEARSADALIDIEHDLIHNKRYVTLSQGKGVIIKK